MYTYRSAFNALQCYCMKQRHVELGILPRNGRRMLQCMHVVTSLVCLGGLS